MAVEPVITGAGVALIRTFNIEVLLQTPLAVISVTEPVVPPPHITDTEEVFAAPLIVPPLTVHEYEVAEGAV